MYYIDNVNISYNYSYVFSHQFFNDDQISFIEYNAEKTKKESGSVSEEQSIETNVRRSEISWILPSSINDEIYEYLIDKISEINDLHFKFNLTYLEDLQYSTYHSDQFGHYDWHVDKGQLRSPYNDIRKLSFSILLNSPNEFEGGEFYVRQDQDPLEVTELQKGSIVVFPSYLMHKVAPVTQGTRKSIVGWFHGPNFI